MIKSSTMMYILRRHVGENDPSQPVCHNEEQRAERENSTKPPVKPDKKTCKTFNFALSASSSFTDQPKLSSKFS